MAKIWFYSARAFPWWEYDSSPQTVKLIAAGRLCHCSNPMDRTGTLNEYNMEYTPIPNTDGFNKDIDQVFMERAKEIWSMGKPVVLFWSGGIDSSGVFLALLETKKPSDTLIVRSGKSSIDEFPEMWEGLVKQYATIHDRRNVFDPEIQNNEDYIKVTGQCGDQLFGSDSLINKTDIMHEPWQILFDLDFVTHWYRMKKGQPVPDEEGIRRCKTHISEILEILIPLAPIEVKSLFDFYWWVNFSLKWDSVDRRICGRWANTNQYKSTIAFYNCDDFQRWSIVNHDLKIQKEWNTYKQPVKEFIHKYFPCENYRKNKIKIGSLDYLISSNPEEMNYEEYAKTWSNPDQYKLILDDGRSWKMDDEIPYEVVRELRGPIGHWYLRRYQARKSMGL